MTIITSLFKQKKIIENDNCVIKRHPFTSYNIYKLTSIYLSIKITFHYYHEDITKIQTKYLTKLEFKALVSTIRFILSIFETIWDNPIVNKKFSLSKTESRWFLQLFFSFAINCSSSFKQNQDQEREPWTTWLLVLLHWSFSFVRCWWSRSLKHHRTLRSNQFSF